MEPLSDADGRPSVTTLVVLFVLDGRALDIGASDEVLAWIVSSCIVVDIEKSWDEREQTSVEK